MKIFLSGGLSPWMAETERLLAHEHKVFRPDSIESKDSGVFAPRIMSELRSSDLVLALMTHDNPSGCGLSFEVGYATALGIPVFFVDETVDTRMDMIRGSGASQFSTLSEAVAGLLA